MNPYNIYKDKFFNRIADLIHSVQVTQILMNYAAREYSDKQEEALFALSNLIIHDWTGPDDNGFAIAYPTGKSSFTLNSHIEDTKERIASEQGCYVFAQSVEAIEALIKDCLYTKAVLDESFKTKLMKKMDMKSSFKREELPSGKGKLFKCLKDAIPDFCEKKFGNGIYVITITELLQTYFHCRHAITHASNNLKSKLLNTTQSAQVEDMFSLKKKDDVLKLTIDEVQMQRGPDKIAEAGFQIYKAFCETEGLTWTIEINSSVS